MKKDTVSPIFLLAIAGSGLALYLYYRRTVTSGSFMDFLNDLATRGSLEVQSVSGDFASKAANFISGHEGFSAKAYPDPPGQYQKYSIGYGHQITGTDGLNPNSVIDQPTALTLLSNDVGFAISCVEQLVEVTLTDDQKIALVDFVYNLGCGAFQGSTLLRLLNNGDYSGAANEFNRWIYANGNILQALVDRRQSEMELFLA